MSGPESQAASHLARTLYRDAPLRVRLQQRFRPSVCSFDPLLPEILAGGGRLLDFGCGAGLFTFHCVVREYASSADGVDIDPSVIRIADQIRESLPQAGRLRFHVREVPVGPFDAISMIDVMHHLPPETQRATFADLCGRLSPGGVFVYKDMGQRPRWRAAANRVHDLVLNRQWIHYVSIQKVIDWAVEDFGLQLVRQAHFNQLVYGHELAVFRKPGETITSRPG